MSIDALTYNNITAKNIECCQNAVLSGSSFTTANSNLQESIGNNTFTNAVGAAWPLITPTGCLCVLDQSANLRCGASCTWTVPGGATRVQFQIWGAGSSTTGGCCCGGSPFGATGAYATTVINATPGDQYVLCAGCAANCCACSNGAVAPGCSSYVTGNRLSNFCAMGGCTNLYYRQCTINPTAFNGCCKYTNPFNTISSGACICNAGNNYCFSNSCSTCGFIPSSGMPIRTFYGTPYGVNSQMGSTCLDTNNYGFEIHPAIPGICHTEVGCCCAIFSSGTCCGGNLCNASTGALNVPGAGGFYTHAMGGGTAGFGDTGRTGMVRVTWC